jgi:hypothetical protein
MILPNALVPADRRREEHCCDIPPVPLFRPVLKPALGLALLSIPVNRG